MIAFERVTEGQCEPILFMIVLMLYCSTVFDRSRGGSILEALITTAEQSRHAVLNLKAMESVNKQMFWFHCLSHSGFASEMELNATIIVQLSSLKSAAACRRAFAPKPV
jgi:hypothetical protein